MFRLHIAEPSIQTGTVAVSWSVKPELLKALAEKGVKTPWILLIAIPTDKYERSDRTPDVEQRFVCTLTEGVCYIPFKTAGEHHIHGIIIWEQENKSDNEATQREIFLLDYNKKWNRCWISSEGFNDWVKRAWRIQEVIVEDERRATIAAMDTIQVSIPRDCFAKPPPVWEQAWVNFFFRYPPIDQCEYDKRRLWAYSIQLPIVLFNWLIRIVVTLFAWLSGFKHVNWNPVVHLLSTDIEETEESFRNGNYFWPKKWNKTFLGRHARLCLLSLCPSILLTVFWVMRFVEFHLDIPMSTTFIHTAIVYSIGWIGIPLVLMALHLLLSIFLIGTGFIFGRKEQSTKAQEKKAPLPEYLDPQTVEFLQNKDGARTYSTTPRRYRTVQLWFQDTKARRCRPYAR